MSSIVLAVMLAGHFRVQPVGNKLDGEEVGTGKREEIQKKVVVIKWIEKQAITIAN